MNVHRLGFLTILSFLGCPSQGDPLLDRPIPTGPDEGRLSTSGYEAEGVRLATAVHDAVLDIECWPAKDGFGVTRCLPAQTAFVTYRDAACTEPIVQASLRAPENAPPSYVTVHRERACGETFAAPMIVGRPVPGAGAYAILEGRCQQAYPAAFFGGMTGFFEAKAIEPTWFLSMTVVREGSSDDLDLEVALAADGLRVPMGLVDRRRGERCRANLVDGQWRCGPDEWIQAVYQDDACDEERVFALGGGCAGVTPRRAWLRPAAACVSFSLVDLLSPIGGAVDYHVRIGEDECVALDAASSSSTLLSVEMLDPAVELPRIRPSARTPARLEVLSVQERLFYDHETDEVCRPVEIGDELRCIPSNTLGQVETFFTDAGCTEAVRLVQGPVSIAGLVYVDGPEAGLYAVGDPVDTSGLFVAEGQACRPFSESIWRAFGACGDYHPLEDRADATRYAVVRAGPLP